MSDGLTVEDLTVRFGGLTAVDGLSFAVPAGRLTGLIGPNGAGKTTTFNACSGLVRPYAGRMTLGGHEISHLGPSARARLGLGRTFQRLELFDRLTVGENVALAREARIMGDRLLGSLWSTRAERAEVAGRTREAIDLCGLGDLCERRVGVLSTGTRRLVELARGLAGGFDILLLDEPSSGLDAAETAAFGGILTSVVRERGTGILLVEHDMSLVTSVCDEVYVLDFGKLIEHGAVADIIASDIVRAAYLGTEEVLTR